MNLDGANRILEGVVPSHYLDGSETGGKTKSPIAREVLGEYLASQATYSVLPRADDFTGFMMADGETRLLQAIGHATTRANAVPDEDEGFDLPDPYTEEAA